MVDYYGVWKAENDYGTYPKEYWCDLDYVAAWIKNTNYNPKTNIENLVEMVFTYYKGYLNDNDVEFYMDMKESENGLMISIEDISCYVEEHGGLKEFDYYC